MAGGSPQPKNEKMKRVYYVDSKDILEYCKALGNAVLIDGLLGLSDLMQLRAL